MKIHASDFTVAGLQLTFSSDTVPTYTVDCRLPFGARKSPEIFNELTQAVRRIMASKGFPNIIAYLDDFLVVGNTHAECKAAMNALMSTLRILGFRLNYNKVEGPQQCLVFLGIEINTLNMTISLSASRIQDVVNCLNQIRGRAKVNKKCLQSLAGRLNWATQCVYGGRFHPRRILDMICKLRKPWHRARMTRPLSQDRDCWLHFMAKFNCTTPMVDNRPAAPVCIDACPLTVGSFFQGDVSYANFASDWP